MQETSARPGLRYVAGEHVASELAQRRDHVLGLVGFGPADRTLDATMLPFAHTGMPVVGVARIYELWLSPQPVLRDLRGAIVSARNEQVMFGVVEIPAHQGRDYDALIYEEYCRIFDYLDAAGYPNLLRAWHYLPDIHGEERSMERYKRFSLGRHEAFVAKGRAVSRDAPAASAVGKRDGATVVVFLSALRPGVPIENPRQVSAYSYPAQYGPRGPTFSRALVAAWNGMPHLYVSGTASIFGHLSRHEGDVAAQANETILNLRSVMDEARGLVDVDDFAGMQFKVYLREPAHRPLVESRLRAAFGQAPRIVCLQAEICRRELLVEIELVVANAPA